MSFATRVVRRVIVPILRRVLPRRLKRSLKRWWDPNVIVSSDEMRIMAVRAAERSARSGHATPRRPPVICFSIFPWEFRRQRPQHLLSRLVRRGHRVLYVERTTVSLRKTTEVRRIESGVDEVLLALPKAFIDLEHQSLPADILETALDALATLRREQELHDAVMIVQMPSWAPIALEARRRFGWRIVYDCMDDWEHFPTVAPAVADAERTLVREADQVMVSSEALREKWRSATDRLTVVRNGVEVEHFRRADEIEVLPDVPRPVIGYVGAIAEWFDVDAVAAAAAALPSCTFVLVGRVTNISLGPLESLPNVRLLGEKPYDVVPAYLSSFDVCLIPFRAGPLMSGTNPVKLYEYFSLGKAVVSAPMPEVMRHGELVYVASTVDEWAAKITEALAESSPDRREERVEVAKASDWDARAGLVDRVIASAHPKLSFIVVTFNNSAMTRLCLDSIEENVSWPNREVIVVDNASTDSTREDLEDRHSCLSGQAGVPVLHLILNDDNRGFAAAMNQGIAAATGERLLLLNNDTVLPSALTGALMRHLDDPAIGLVVAVTNFSGNESRIDVDYETFEGIEPFATRRRAEHDGERFDIEVAALYCVALTAGTLARVGPLDERFGIGMFEDDDYSQRVRAAGLRVVCAEDAFVHHFGRAAFGQIPSADYDRLFAANREKFEKKWGTWKGHRGR